MKAENMNQLIILIVYFVVGIVQNFVFTLNVKYVALNKVLWASFYSFLTAFINMIVLYNILTRLDEERGLLTIFIYALGIAAGTVAAMKFRIGTGKK